MEPLYDSSFCLSLQLSLLSNTTLIIECIAITYGGPSSIRSDMAALCKFPSKVMVATLTAASTTNTGGYLQWQYYAVLLSRRISPL